MKKSKTPKLLKKRLVIACMLMAASAQSLADIANATIKGIVAANAQPKAGLVVEANNLGNGHKFTTVTKSDGSFNLSSLPPGQYSVRLQADTGKAETLVLQVGQTVDVNFNVTVKQDAEKVQEVVVTATLVRASRSGEIGTNITPEQIKNLPQSSRNFLSAADLAPGVAFSQGGDGSTSLRGGAQSASAINVFIDGVGQKNYVLKGGVTGQDSSRGDPFPQSAIKEYQVITQNYSAEFDQLSSAAITAVTASGSNELEGGVFFDRTDESWRAEKPTEKKDNKKVPSSQNQYGVHVAGPIIADRLHFFVAYEGKDNSDPKDVIPAQGVARADLPAQLQPLVGGKTAEFKEDLVFGKLNLAISDTQKMEFTAKIRRENELAGLGGTNTEEHATDKTNRETRLMLNHEYRTDTWLNKVLLNYEDARFNPHPHTIGNGIVLQNSDKKTILELGGGQDFQDKGQKGWGIQNDFTFHGFNGHEIKTGVKYKSLTLTAIEQQPYNAQYYYNVFSSLTVPVSVKWGAPISGLSGGKAEADNKQLGFYIQDNWQLTERLETNLGLRWDYEESSSYLDYVTPPDVLAGIAGWQNIRQSNIDINQFVSNGNNREAFKDAWQPRLGFTYQLNDEQLELFGGVGRAYDRNLFDYVQTEITKATFPTYEYYFSATNPPQTCSGNNCVAWDPAYLTPAGRNSLIANSSGAGREVHMLSNNLKTPYSDQMNIGLRDTFGDWNAEVSLAHISSQDGFTWMLANRRPGGAFFEPGNTWGSPWNFGIPGLGNTLIGVNGVETKTDAIYVKAEKPYDDVDNWGFSAAYTFSHAKQNRKLDDPYALDYPNIGDYEFLPSTTVPKHRLVMAGTMGLPWDVTLSSKWTVETQKPITGTDCRAGWGACKYSTMTPETKGIFGFNQWDIALRKTVLPNIAGYGRGLELRLDLLNVMNTRNYAGFEDWFGGAGEESPANLGKPNLSLAGPTRTFKLGVNWEF